MAGLKYGASLIRSNGDITLPRCPIFSCVMGYLEGIQLRKLIIATGCSAIYPHVVSGKNNRIRPNQGIHDDASIMDLDSVDQKKDK